ncbi:MAG: hypothetical protein M0R38_10420 [Bacteroidia bacterium]|nr:hypothetical protein [Bacteroidia bacterium]
MKLYVMQTEIDIDAINSRISLLFNSFPYQIMELSYEDFLKGEKSFYTKKKLNKYKKWFKDSNRKAYGVIIDNKLVYSSWVCLDKVEITNKTSLKSYENVGLLQEDYCSIKYRGRGLQKYSILMRVKVVYGKGRDKAIGIVRIDNTPSIKAFENGTFKIVDTIELISLFGKEFVRKITYDC